MNVNLIHPSIRIEYEDNDVIPMVRIFIAEGILTCLMPDTKLTFNGINSG